MVTIGMNYKVIKGKEEAFENAFGKVVAALAGADGHSESRMFRDISDAQHYLIISQWSRKASFDAFVASDTFRNIVNWGKEEILSDRPHHEIYGGDESAGDGACPAGAH